MGSVFLVCLGAWHLATLNLGLRSVMTHIIPFEQSWFLADEVTYNHYLYLE